MYFLVAVGADKHALTRFRDDLLPTPVREGPQVELEEFRRSNVVVKLQGRVILPIAAKKALAAHRPD